LDEAGIVLSLIFDEDDNPVSVLADISSDADPRRRRAVPSLPEDRLGLLRKPAATIGDCSVAMDWPPTMHQRQVSTGVMTPAEGLFGRFSAVSCSRSRGS